MGCLEIDFSGTGFSELDRASMVGLYSALLCSSRRPSRVRRFERWSAGRRRSFHQGARAFTARGGASQALPKGVSQTPWRFPALHSSLGERKKETPAPPRRKE